MTKGKDLQNKEVIIELKDKKYSLNFDLNAMAELEDKYGSMNEAIKQLKSKKMSAVRTFLYAVLKSSDETLTEFEVGKLIDMNNFSKLEKSLTSLINSAFEETDSKGGKQTKN